jgi:hypothetical protein
MADDLPALLELLHESDRRWRTLRAEGDQWADPERSRGVEPLPPAGRLGVVVEWQRRDLAETRADLDAGAILEAARRAETL